MTNGRPRIAVIASAHPVDDMRVLHREGLSMAEWADITVWGVRGPQREYGTHVRTRVLPSRQGRMWRILRLPWLLAHAAIGDGAEYLHVHDPEALLAALFLGRRHSARVIFDNHENYPQVMLSKEWVPRLLRRPLSVMMRAAYRVTAQRADLVITPTSSLARQFEELGATVAVVRNFPPLRVFDAPGALPGRTRVEPVDFLHLGTVSGLRLETFVDIINAVEELRPGCTWAFIGLHDEVRPRLSAALSESQRSRVRIEGQIPAEDVPRALACARVGVNWHPDIEQFRTAIPNKVPEYLMAGLRVVTTGIPELAELVPPADAEAHGVAYAGRDVTEFARSLVSALDAVLDGRPPDSNQIRAFVRATISWEAEAQHLRDAYAAVIDEREGRA